MTCNVEYFNDNKIQRNVVEEALSEIKDLLKTELVENEVPNTLMLTYKDINEIPKEIIKLWQDLNPMLKIKLYDDKSAYSYLYNNYGTIAAKRFESLPDGPIKADFFRVHYMYIEGGFYADADIRPVKKIETMRCAKHIVSINSGNKFHREINPMFFSCPKKHIGLKIAIEIYKILFEKLPYTYWTYSVVKIFTFIFEQYPHMFQLYLQEVIDWENRENDFVYDTRFFGKSPVMYNRNFKYNSKIHKYIA